MLRTSQTRTSGTKTALVQISAAVNQDEACYADEDDEKSKKHAKSSVKSECKAPSGFVSDVCRDESPKTYMNAFNVPKNKMMRPTQRWIFPYRVGVWVFLY